LLSALKISRYLNRTFAFQKSDTAFGLQDHAKSYQGTFELIHKSSVYGISGSIQRGTCNPSGCGLSFDRHT
jgi:hypothetical protein